MRKRQWLSKFLRWFVYIAAFLTISALLFLIAYILIKGIPHLSLSLFSIHYTSENVSVFPALINTLTMTGISLLIAAPLGIFAAIYLVEYAHQTNRFIKFVRITSETLAGIPSIVFGLFGYLLFVTTFKLGFSLLAGGLTLSVMILPLIMRTTEEALKAVPDSFREGSYGLGAGKLRTIFKIVLPAAIPGILAGIVLSIGRIVGETAALIYTAGTVAQIPASILGSGRTLSVHMFALWNEGLNPNESYATAVLLLLLVILLNFISRKMANRLEKGKQHE
ncbi:MAG TPA: phosphate ABC transporter permease PstA [Bacilli bacterium]|nr:MAG: Phosphate transport system permease protein PstA [Tenericutes bacterium ADurb.BinA124]HPX84702.1 phosphate ABC transporter permease PstA [Bacilli bacterium]